VILLGATGAGKTYLACALGMAANRNFYNAKYIACQICWWRLPWLGVTEPTGVHEEAEENEAADLG
jgi:hypothetical protein